MGSRTGDGNCTGGMTGPDAEAGALVWVVRRNGCWWPGRILATDELPEDCSIPPRSAGTPVKLLGCPDGSIDWYNVEKSKRVKPFRCGEFAECIENAKVRGPRQNKVYSKKKYTLIDDAIMNALEIETSHFPNKEPTNQITECRQEYISSIQVCRETEMKITSFDTPISKENHKRDSSSLSQLDEGAMKYRVVERDLAGLDARMEGDVFKPTELENTVEVYDVEVAAYGNFKGRGVPLAFLLSKTTGKPIKGYPVTVEIMEDSHPAPSTEVHHREVGHFGCLMESRISVPWQPRSLRKPSGSRKISDHDLDKSWGPSRWSFSSYHNLAAKYPREISNRKTVVAEDTLLPIRSTSKPASSARKMGSFSSFPDSQGENANRKPLVLKVFPRLSHSGPVDDSENNTDEFDSDNGADKYQSDSSTDEYQNESSTDEYHGDKSSDEYHTDSSADEDYMKLAAYLASSRGSPSFFSPAPPTSSGSLNGYTALYMCSASTMCAPVRLCFS